MNIQKTLKSLVIMSLLLAPLTVDAQRSKPRNKKAKPNNARVQQIGRGQVDAVLTKKRLIVSSRTPIILIHGVGGSNLKLLKLTEQEQSRGIFNDGFPNDVLKSILGDPYKLQFEESGKPANNEFSERMGAKRFYDVPSSSDITDLSEALQKEGFLLDQNLFEFAYDFRYSVPEIAETLRQKIDSIKLQTGRSQVDIVAHSMGGMIAKQYLLDEQNQANVKNVIFVGTPHLGAPKTLKAMRYGDDLNVSLIDGCKLKRAVHNMPSMFNLLPGKRYFEVAKGGYFEDAADIDGDGVRGVLDYEKMLFNLDNGRERLCPMQPDKDDLPPFDNLSEKLIAEHTDKFHAAQDNWQQPENINVYAIAGYGVPTIKGFKETDDVLISTLTTEGDGTVPLWSAETVDADAVYYINLNELIIENFNKLQKSEHSEMIAAAPVVRQINQLLLNGAGVYDTNFAISRPTGFTITETESAITKKRRKPQQTNINRPR